MSSSPRINPPTTEIAHSGQTDLPLNSLVRAVCEAANAGPDRLYEVMLKLSLMVESAAPTYGLSIWTCLPNQKPRLEWVEGLQRDEIAGGEAAVTQALSCNGRRPDIKEGDSSICLVLSLPRATRPGAAIFGRCVRPLNHEQAKDLQTIVEVAHLAHSHTLSLNCASPSETSSAISSSTLPGMVFSSKVMAEVARAVERIKDSDSTVLVSGESGTGKELIARAIHRLSRRSEREFVPFNCSAVPAELVESMLFGHRRGTFTGALSDNTGLIRAAENGTLFLDEIGDLPLPLQPKLLRFLQEGEVHTLGEHAPRQVSVRVIAATHKDLEGLVREKLFREDLYYRITTLNVRVPPLRERPEDISTLISHFISHYSRRNDRPIAGITWEAIRILEEYSWPGNVRELAGEIERLVLYADAGGYILPDHISARIMPPDDDRGAADRLEVMLENYERKVITETLKRHDCNVARASEALGLGSRQTLYKKLKRLAIDVSEFLQEDTKPGMQFRVPDR